MNKASVLIIGCGWLGKKIARRLATVVKPLYGSTRSQESAKELSNLGIIPVILEFPFAKEDEVELPEVDHIIISITPNRKAGDEYYPENLAQIGRVISSQNSKAQVFMFSSTSVYGNLEGEVSEESVDPDAKAQNLIQKAEGKLRNELPDSNILRLAGLMGDDRHPVHYLAGRKDVSDGDAPINLVHSDFIIDTIMELMERNTKSEIFNLVGEEHPTKREYYTKIAKERGLEIPTFEVGGERGKVVVGVKARKVLEG